MDPLRTLQRRGATGSIARWAFETYTGVQEHFPYLDEAAICKLMFQRRYEAIEPLESEEEAFTRISADPENYSDLPSLCTAIAEIECGITLSEDEELWHQVVEVMDEELTRLGYYEKKMNN